MVGGISPSDAVAWDLSIEVWTGPGGTGTLLGKSGYRNTGQNERFQLVVVCDELEVDANFQETMWVRANYSTATPTTGFVPSGTGDNAFRCMVRPFRF
jgi:hypothetical protein